jgi:hypothetical protein
MINWENEFNIKIDYLINIAYKAGSDSIISGGQLNEIDELKIKLKSFIKQVILDVLDEAAGSNEINFSEEYGAIYNAVENYKAGFNEHRKILLNLKNKYK